MTALECLIETIQKQAAIANRPGLVQRTVTVHPNAPGKQSFQRRQWVRPEEVKDTSEAKAFIDKLSKISDDTLKKIDILVYKLSSVKNIISQEEKNQLKIEL